MTRANVRRCVFAGALLLTAAALSASVPIVFGRPLPRVVVTWTKSGAERLELERQFALSEATEISPGRWSYVPLDTGRERLRALVQHPRVGDTDGIDRRSFSIDPSGPLTERRGGWISPAPAWGGPLAKFLALGLAFLGIGFCAVAVSVSRGWRPSAVALVMRDRTARHAAAAEAVAWARDVALQGIPVMSAQAAAAFRVVFLTLVTVYLLRNPVYRDLLNPTEVARAEGPYGLLVQWLAAYPAVVDWIGIAVAASGALAIAGAATAVVYPVFVVVFVLWASVYTLAFSQHVVSALGMTLICLLPSRWADAWSADAWLWRRSHQPAGPSRRYGFTAWIPCFVLGATYLMAAISKLQEGGAWILNGTVKYHFASDFEHAWVPWGIALTQVPGVAVAMSAAAVLIELSVISASFSRSIRYRVTTGLCAAALLLGFALFQGIVWPGWWLLLLGFLPWQWIRSATAVAAMDSMPRAQSAVVGMFVALHAVVTVARAEARPIISAYDMYATTYANDEEYVLSSDLTYRVFIVTPDGARHALSCTVDDDDARLVESAAAGDVDARRRTRLLLAPCVRGGPPVTQLVLEGDREVFDWTSRRHMWTRGVDEVGPIDAGWLEAAGE